MRPHKNTGARFVRHDGTTWASGEVHVPTPLELKRRAYKLVPATLFGAPEDPGREAEAGRPDDPEALPDGYTAEHVAGGYYTVTAPDGSAVEGPSGGKWQGRDGAAAGARAHARREAGGGTDD